MIPFGKRGLRAAGIGHPRALEYLGHAEVLVPCHALDAQAVLPKDPFDRGAKASIGILANHVFCLFVQRRYTLIPADGFSLAPHVEIEQVGVEAVLGAIAEGIGESTAKVFAAQGLKVVLVGRRADRGEAIAEEIRQEGGEALFCKTDVTSEEDVAQLMQTALDAYGSLDVLVNYVTGAVIPVDAAMSSGNFIEVPWKEPDPRS